MTDDAASPQWHPMKPTWSFSDYGEWLDEGTTTTLEDMGGRAPAPPASRPPFDAVPAADYDITVVHDEAEQAYKALFGNEPIGYLSYRLVGGRVALWSASVLPAYRDHGVAAELIAKALDDIRASGKKITVICPIVRRMIDHYPQYEDLVDPDHPGVQVRHPA